MGVEWEMAEPGDLTLREVVESLGKPTALREENAVESRAGIGGRGKHLADERESRDGANEGETPKVRSGLLMVLPRTSP